MEGTLQLKSNSVADGKEPGRVKSSVFTCDICHVRTSVGAAKPGLIKGLVGMAGSYGCMYWLWLSRTDWQHLWDAEAVNPVISAFLAVGLIVMVGFLFLAQRGFVEFLVRFQNPVVRPASDASAGISWGASAFPMSIAIAGVIAVVGAAGFVYSIGVFGEKMLVLVAAALAALLLRYGRKRGAKRPMPLAFVAVWVSFSWIIIS
ncbi:MAG: hypothetical protein JKY34_11010 [Kordiimonadaceae bacterium]|nr:hypothetical protein [Kordiimonadaceae bacterium]